MIEVDLFHLLVGIVLTFAFFCGILGVVLGIFCLVSIKALEKSTHNIHYIPADPSWSSSDKDIAEINEKAQMGMALDPDELEPDQIDLKKMI